MIRTLRSIIKGTTQERDIDSVLTHFSLHFLASQVFLFLCTDCEKQDIDAYMYTLHGMPAKKEGQCQFRYSEVLIERDTLKCQCNHTHPPVSD